MHKKVKCVVLCVYLACVFAGTSAVAFAQSDETCEAKFRANMYSVCLVDAREGWVCGDGGLIYHTEDGGLNWKIQPMKTKEALFSISFVNPEVGWVVGNKGLIFHTTDGGTTWEPQTSPKSKILFTLSAISEQKAIAAGDWGTIVYTSDGGKTWEDRTYPKDMMMYGIDFVDENEGWIAGEFGTVLHTADGGETWEKQETGIEHMLYSVSFSSKLDGMASGIDGMLIMTSDGGQTWQQVEYWESEGDKIELPEDLAAGAEDERTLEVRQEYIKQQTQRSPLFEVKYLDNVAVAVGDAGVYHLSKDKGKTWNKPTLPSDMGLLWFRGVSLVKKGDDVVGVTVGAKSVCIVNENIELSAIGYLPSLTYCKAPE